jgi:MYXO-CTERM domain-containing protein
MKTALPLAVLLLGVLAPSTSWAVASAELYSTQAYVYGRFEARIRYAPGDGVISSFFLWKEGSETSGTFWNELDFEKMNANCRMQTNAIFGDPEAGHEQSHTDLGDLCGAYHDYGFEWTPTYIAWLFDGREIRRETGSTATAFSQNATAGMTFHFNVWPGNENFGGNFDASKLPTRQYISWVRYSSFSNGSFQQQWQQDFQGNTLPSGWAVGSWESPLKLSTHNTANVGFASGIAVLSLTADNATGFSGTPPSDASGAGGAMSGTGGASGGIGGKTSGGAGNLGGTTSAGGSQNSSGGAGAGGSQSSSGGAGVGGSQNSSGGAGVGGSQNPSGGAQASGGTNAAAGGSSASFGGASSGGAASSLGGATGASGSLGGSVGSSLGGATNPAYGGVSSHAGAPASGGSTANKGSDSGCSCSAVPAGSHAFVYEAFGLGAMLVAVRRRRRVA